MSRSALYWAGALLVLVIGFAGCQSPPGTGRDGALPPGENVEIVTPPRIGSEPVPWDEPLSLRGNPPSYRVFGEEYRVRADAIGYRETGVASWYGPGFHGKLTSNGEVFDMYAISAAHKSLPLPTFVRVTNLQNGKSIIARINDRGPFTKNRLIDLSYAAATRLDMIQQGTALVEVESIVAPARLDQPSELRENTPPLCPVQVFIQTGAFADKGNAERLLNRLGAAGFTGAVLLVLDDGSSAPHKVGLPAPSPDDVTALDALLERLSQLGFAPVHIVVKRGECGS